MTENIEKLSFEDALSLLSVSADKLKSGSGNLEESVAVYEKSILLYNHCVELLQNAKQKIELYRPETGKTEDFNEY